MGFLLVSQSFLLASLILKSESVVEYFFSPAEKMFGKKHLIEDPAANMGEIDMNGKQSNMLTAIWSSMSLFTPD